MYACSTKGEKVRLTNESDYAASMHRFLHESD